MNRCERLSISLPPEVEEAVKSQATKEGKPLADYVESLVEEGSKRWDRIDLDEVLPVFNHLRSQRELGASVFWTRPGAVLLETVDEFVAYWQVTRELGRRASSKS